LVSARGGGGGGEKREGKRERRRGQMRRNEEGRKKRKGEERVVLPVGRTGGRDEDKLPPPGLLLDRPPLFSVEVSDSGDPLRDYSSLAASHGLVMVKETRSRNRVMFVISGFNAFLTNPTWPQPPVPGSQNALL